MDRVDYPVTGPEGRQLVHDEGRRGVLREDDRARGIESLGQGLSTLIPDQDRGSASEECEGGLGHECRRARTQPNDVDLRHAGRIAAALDRRACGQ